MTAVRDLLERRSLLTLCVVALCACRASTTDTLPPIAGTLAPQPPAVCSAVPVFQHVPRQIAAVGNPASCITKDTLRTMKFIWVSERAPQPKAIVLDALPVQLWLSGDGRIQGLGFEGACGMTYYPTEATRECLMRELRGWRYDIQTGECPHVFWGPPEELLLPAIDEPEGSPEKAGCIA